MSEGAAAVGQASARREGHSMSWDPTFRPRLRAIEPFRTPDMQAGMIGLRDPTGLSPAVLTVSEPAAVLLAMMDGETTCARIRARFSAEFGQAVAVETMAEMIGHLEAAHFLDGEAFEAHYASLVRAYRANGVREMLHAEAMGLADGADALFDEILVEAAADGVAADSIRGLVAPHLDYARGRPCYGAAYGAIRRRRAPDRVVILGTNHFGRSTSVVATGKDFRTPLGTTRCDAAFLESIEARCGTLRAFELDHAREHSIELQVMWLQHLFGADAFSIVPFLCPDPCGPTGTAPRDGNGVDLRRFASILGELIAESKEDTFLIAGADLSHVGLAFGDERSLDAESLAEVEARDRRALSGLTTGGGDDLVRCVAEGGNPTNVCSAGCIFTLATALPDNEATLLAYHQAVTREAHTCVTCAALAFA